MHSSSLAALTLRAWPAPYLGVAGRVFSLVGGTDLTARDSDPGWAGNRDCRGVRRGAVPHCSCTLYAQINSLTWGSREKCEDLQQMFMACHESPHNKTP